jgi:hypothetical protein
MVGFGFYFSGDNGTTWDVIAGSANLTSLSQSLYVNDSSIFVGTYGSGIWKLPLSTITSVKQPKPPAIPASFDLQQNYPNPFNPSTIIRYGLPLRSQVALNIYNTLGQQVAMLVNRNEEAGYHSVRFDGSNLASGVYFYRLQAGTYVETRKLLLLR